MSTDATVSTKVCFKNLYNAPRVYCEYRPPTSNATWLLALLIKASLVCVRVELLCLIMQLPEYSQALYKFRLDSASTHRHLLTHSLTSCAWSSTLCNVRQQFVESSLVGKNGLIVIHTTTQWMLKRTAQTTARHRSGTTRWLECNVVPRTWHKTTQHKRKLSDGTPYPRQR